MNIKELKKELAISNLEIARFFGFDSVAAYQNSSAKPRYEEALVKFYLLIKSRKKDS